MSEFLHPNKTRPSARGPAYIWEYEYYDDDEPVSFEGLKAHRYSIVIGFWVGLTVFVIFMFFVLTLLTKTGAPHQDVGRGKKWDLNNFDNSQIVLGRPVGHSISDVAMLLGNPEQCEKRTRLTSCVVDISQSQNTGDKACSRPLLDESRSLFHCFIHEEEQGRDAVRCKAGGRVTQAPSLDLQVVASSQRTEREPNLLAHFNIPNFVNSEPSSTLGDDDLLLCEPPIILDSLSCPERAHHNS